VLLVDEWLVVLVVVVLEVALLVLAEWEEVVDVDETTP
jgi:hypothetical protein